MPTPQGLSPRSARLRQKGLHVRLAHQAGAKGKAPPSATARANSALSLTRVMAPWMIGYRVP